MTDRVGQRLGNYRLVKLLGRGGFAEVYLGEHVHLQTQAAVKVLHTQLEGADVAGFQREAQTIARLMHPHIVRVLDFAVQEGVPYLAMDYAPYGTLRQQHDERSLPLETVVRYVKQMADALQYAHDQRIVHRDIKPENMLVGRRHELLLSDFGIAVTSQSSRYQTTHQMTGTVAYMAPEQIQGHPRPASDQYALAVVVYEWLTGERPFQGAITEVAMQQLVVPPKPLREKMPSIAEPVDQVVLTALAKEPQERFASIRAFANALEQASQIKSVHDASTFFMTPPTKVAPPGNVTPVLSPFTPATPPNAAGRSPAMGTPHLPESYQTNLMPPSGPGTPPVPGVNYATNQMPPAAPMVIGTPRGAGSEPTMGNAPATWNDPASRGAYPPAAPRSRPPAAMPPPVQPPSPQGGISRRAVVLAGAGGLAVIAGGSVLAWLGLSHKQTNVQPTPTTRPTTGPSATPPPPLGTRLLTYSGHGDYINTVAWSPDGRHIASGSGNNNGDYSVRVWDARSGDTALTYSKHSSNVYSVAWSPDGSRIASGAQDKTAQVWDAGSGQRLQNYSRHSDSVYTVAWSPDGNHIASGGRDNTVQIWDPRTGNLTFTYTHHQSFVHSALWSKSGTRIASASGDDQADLDNSVQVWDALSGGHRVTYSGHPKPVIAVDWSPDGTRIASASLDKTVQVWKVSNGALQLTLSGHAQGVSSVAWSPDGKYIASGSYDNTVNIWDAASGTKLYTYTGHANGVSTVSWSHDSQRVASGSFDTTVQVWQAR